MAAVVKLMVYVEEKLAEVVELMFGVVKLVAGVRKWMRVKVKLSGLR